VGKPLALRATVTDDMVVDPRRPPDAQKLFVSWSSFRGVGLVLPQSEIGRYHRDV
jgi:hypothetical protein